jgi:hypothetical protein
MQNPIFASPTVLSRHTPFTFHRVRRIHQQLGTGSLDSSNSPYDSVMFCMPDGTMFGEGGRTTWAAFAYTGDRAAFFQKGYYGVMSTTMHELGHLMGFGHSIEGTSICQDKPGVLGSSIRRIDQRSQDCTDGLDGREEEADQHALYRFQGVRP